MSQARHVGASRRSLPQHLVTEESGDLVYAVVIRIGSAAPTAAGR